MIPPQTNKRRPIVEYVAIVTGLALLQVFIFSIQVGQQRGKHDVKAPAVTGHPEFERAYRIHQNTIEQVIIFLPSLWIFATYWRPDIAAGLGLLFIVGRQVYRGAYMEDPTKRAAGFATGAIAVLVLLVGGLIGAIMKVV